MWQVTFQAVVFWLEGNVDEMRKHVIIIPACHHKADNVAKKTNMKKQTCQKEQKQKQNNFL